MKVKVINLAKLNLLKYRSYAAVSIIVAISLLAGFYFKTNRDYVNAEAVLAEEQIIILDAGHGGEDPGATSASGKHEKDLNLEIALCLGEMLTEKGYTVVYTRTEDKLLYTDAENIKGIRKISDLKNRCKVAREYPNALFVSIHMNSFSESKYSGLQVYYSTKNEGSESLATHIQSSVKRELQPANDRKIKPGSSIYVLENIENPAVLIECGFLTNPEEAEKLSKKEYQNLLSFSIICGIIEYMNINT